MLKTPFQWREHIPNYFWLWCQISFAYRQSLIFLQEILKPHISKDVITCDKHTLMYLHANKIAGSGKICERTKRKALQNIYPHTQKRRAADAGRRLNEKLSIKRNESVRQLGQAFSTGCWAINNSVCHGEPCARRVFRWGSGWECRLAAWFCIRMQVVCCVYYVAN